MMKTLIFLINLIFLSAFAADEKGIAGQINEDFLLERFGDQMLLTIRPKFMELIATYDSDLTSSKNAIIFRSQESTPCTNMTPGEEVASVQIRTQIRDMDFGKKMIQTITYNTCHNQELFSEILEIEGADPKPLSKDEILIFSRKFQVQNNEVSRTYRISDAKIGEFIVFNSRREGNKTNSKVMVGDQQVIEYSTTSEEGFKVTEVRRNPFSTTLIFGPNARANLEDRNEVSLTVLNRNGFHEYYAGGDRNSRGGFETNLESNFTAIFAILRSILDMYVGQFPLAAAAPKSSKMKTELEDFRQKLLSRPNDPVVLKQLIELLDLYIQANQQGTIIDNRP